MVCLAIKINLTGCFLCPHQILLCSEAFSLPFLPYALVLSAQRKPEEESPVKDTDAKQLKQEATVNGSGDSSNSNETQEGKSKEASG